MNLALVVLGGLTVALVVMHLMREDYSASPPVSIARIVAELRLPKPQHPSYRWGPQNLVASRPFLVRLLLFVLALLAGCSIDLAQSMTKRSLGLWLVVDTSASMTTVQDGKTRMALVQAEAEQAVRRSVAAASDAPLCWRLAAFDSEWQPILAGTTSQEVVLDRVGKLAPRPLGTNLDRLRNLRDLRSGGDCPVTHAVVITDLPPPEWLADLGIPVIWRDIAKPVSNLGISNLSASCETLTGRISELNVEITGYGQVAPGTRLTVRVDGVASTYAPQWRENQTGDAKFPVRTWVQKVPIRENRTFEFELSAGDAYGYDDRAELDIQASPALRVDWQLPDRRVFDELVKAAWQYDPVNPNLRVTGNWNAISSIPTLIVGNDYDRLASAPSSIQVLFDASLLRDPTLDEPSLLRDLNLDAVEALGLVGADPALIPAGFQPVLSGARGIWIAQRPDPPAVYVPGLPVLAPGAIDVKQSAALTAGPDARSRVSTTIFFNAVRWLLRSHRCPSLYQVTDGSHPEPGRNRLVPPIEGNTSGEARTPGRLEDITPAATAATAEPVWPRLLAAVAVLLVVERLLALHGGERWR